MGPSTSEEMTRCRTCTRELSRDALDCSDCKSLVHADELDRISAAAKNLEKKKQWRAARDEWLRALTLLPNGSQQALWVSKHAQDLLNAALDGELPSTQSKWAKRFAPLGPIAVLLAKSKGLFLAIFKLKFLLTFISFLYVDWALFGIRFGTGFALLILIHEMGHFIDIKRRGLPAEMPVFLPGLGAYVSWQALGVTAETRAEVSLAGPLAGWIAALACALIWWKTGNQLWAALARASAVLNVLNLIPVWILDGGQAIAAVSKNERIFLLMACLLIWLIAGEGIFFLVSAGFAWRIFTKDMPAKSSYATTAYYAAVLACLGVLLRFIPGHGFGLQ